MRNHATAHPLAGQTVTVKLAAPDHYGLIGSLDTGDQLRVADWADRDLGANWRTQPGNWAAVNYEKRAAAGGLPTDDEVVYGKCRSFGYLVHVSELVTP